MNWGLKITLLYAGFVILIVSMVSMAMREKVDLVSKDYYELELKYQEKIDRMNNSSTLSEPLSWEMKTGQMVLNFPSELKGKTKKGEIHFFRPSDMNLDELVSIPADTLQMCSFSTEKLKRGVYKMQISWESGIQQFYNEGIIQIH